MRALLLLLLTATPAVAEPPVPAPDRNAQEHVARTMRRFFGPADAAAAGSAATGPAATDPASLAISDAIDSSKIDSSKPAPPVNGSGTGSSGSGARALAFGGGGWAAGIVITPPAHPDARPWPHGAVMAPPATPDANVVVPGTDGVPSLPVRPMPSWIKRITTTLQDGIASLLAYSMPHSL